jgi:hypothetical protein
MSEQLRSAWRDDKDQGQVTTCLTTSNIQRTPLDGNVSVRVFECGLEV